MPGFARNPSMLGSQGRLLGFAFLANPTPGFTRNPSVLGSQGRLPGLTPNPACLGSVEPSTLGFGSLRTQMRKARCWVRFRTQQAVGFISNLAGARFEQLLGSCK
ncbi:hypothetical protein SLEP1_g54021 [Rubroshorea leprosula]|uniref:Uncharacterized protein n=1 Tax=Rubroshorea leprosula TaxID=152421 RepID=A0AAV5MB42_9ROSI|nr:hypothetical protein SLEP1_g54021 [Rubroshorea leprosula]